MLFLCVWSIVVVRGASCRPRSPKAAELQATSTKQRVLRCILRGTFAKHFILQRALQEKHLQNICFCGGLCRSALAVWLIAFLALLFVLLPISSGVACCRARAAGTSAHKHRGVSDFS